MSVAGIVLAAGFSRRLGRPKQLIEIGGETLLGRAVRVARQAELDPVFAVVHAGLGLQIASDHLPCALVWNEEAAEGIASSIRAGVRAAQALPDVVGAVLMTCDQVGTRPEHLRALCAEPSRLTASSYQDIAAVPAYFPREHFAELLTLKGDVGARVLLQQARTLQADALAIDVDTEEDVARAQLLLQVEALSTGFPSEEPATTQAGE